MKKKMAFWRYDQYPYWVCSETSDTVKPKRKDGKTYYFMESYGTFYLPVFILPLEKGRKLKEYLDMLKALKMDADRDSRERFIRMVDNALDKFGVSR